MSETPSHEPSSAAEDVTGTAAAPVATPAAAPAATTPTSHAAGPSKFAKWAAIAALVLAILALAGAAYGYFYPNQSAAAAGKYSDQQRNDSKKHICETFKIVDRAVVRNSHLKNPENGGPIGALSVATAQRFAFYDGGAFLRDRVAAEPATPKDLADNANTLGTQLEELSIGYLAGSQDFAQDELRQNLDDKIKKIVDICK
ncbi:MAG: hypothetical protein QOI33_1063 [Mycobacterium sp.]|jgi:hypothetical protein|nr:hypothetical protein [Mycobacterium sp.]